MTVSVTVSSGQEIVMPSTSAWNRITATYASTLTWANTSGRRREVP